MKLKVVGNMKKIDVIYLAGGIGKRTKLGYPKQFARIAGKPILIYGLEILNKIDEIGKIIIPCAANYVNAINMFKNTYNIMKNIILVKAGETRQESVYNGLSQIKTEYILICEAVRPFITKDFVLKIINEKGNIIPYTKLNSTPFNKKNGDILNRNDIVCVQTPQKYVTNELKKSHEAAINYNVENTTDDLYLMKTIGLYNNFVYIEGLIENIKITYPIDLKISESIWRSI
jgi:2-C-methyl-D-erythritol 4-phosphate cytidylyltransferase